MKLAQLSEKFTHIFIPKSSNNYKAKLLHLSSLVMLLVFVFLFQGSLSIGSAHGLNVLGYKANISPEEVIRLTNEKRAQAGLSPLSENSTLDQAALAKGTDMLNNDYWAHVSPNGTEPWVFFINAGYKYRYAGENLARDFSNPGDTVSAWMASPSHRDNLLSPKYKDIGVAVVEGDLAGVDTTIVVQLFGTKAGDVVPSVPAVAAKEMNSKPNEIQAPVQLAQAELSAAPSIESVSSPLAVTKTISIILASIFLLTLILDGIIIEKKGVYRVGGRTLAHVSFMGMVLAIILIIRSGQIF
jgi:hypothetical protein